MATNYQAQQADFARAVTGFDEISADLKSTMNRLEGELVALLTVQSYDGAQAAAFRNVHDTLRRCGDAASGELNSMSQLVHTTFANYAKGDEESASQLASLNGAVPDGFSRFL